MEVYYDGKRYSNVENWDVDKETYSGSLVSTLRKFISPYDAQRFINEMTEAADDLISIRSDAVESWETFYVFVEEKGQAWSEASDSHWALWEVRSALGHIVNEGYVWLYALLLKLTKPRTGHAKDIFSDTM